MSLNPVSAGSTTSKAELLRRLGVRADASDQDIEAAHNGLVEFLELAPHGVRSWAAARTAEVDEAFALLSGPEQEETAVAPVAAMAQPAPEETFRTPAAVPVASNPRRTQLVWAIVPLLVVAIVFGVFQMGRGSEVPGSTGTPTGGGTTASSSPSAVPVDQAKVAALMAKISANAKDVASLQGLGDLYFASSDYTNASVWEKKVLDVDPKNEKALLALGAAQFNLGNSAAAKEQWLVAAKLYPGSQEVHYDLGFFYMSQTPPDTAKMRSEWKKVVDIDPNSDLAKTVATHINAPAPTPTAK